MTGLEPAAFGVTGQHSDLLSYILALCKMYSYACNVSMI